MTRKEAMMVGQKLAVPQLTQAQMEAGMAVTAVQYENAGMTVPNMDEELDLEQAAVLVAQSYKAMRTAVITQLTEQIFGEAPQARQRETSPPDTDSFGA